MALVSASTKAMEELAALDDAMGNAHNGPPDLTDTTPLRRFSEPLALVVANTPCGRSEVGSGSGESNSSRTSNRSCLGCDRIFMISMCFIMIPNL